VTRYGDGYDEMTRGLDEHGALSTGGAPDDVTQFLTELRLLGIGEPPEPSAEVAALLGAPPSLTRRRATRVLVRSGLAAAALVIAVVAAAANHDLPQPAQRVVSNVVNVLTPFEIAPRKASPPTPPTVVPSVPRAAVPTTPAPHPRATRTAHPIVPVPVPPSRAATRSGDDRTASGQRSATTDDHPVPDSDDGAGSGAARDITPSAAPTRGDDGAPPTGGRGDL
jgi:hypothetical protein